MYLLMYLFICRSVCMCMHACVYKYICICTCVYTYVKSERLCLGLAMGLHGDYVRFYVARGKGSLIRGAPI